MWSNSSKVARLADLINVPELGKVEDRLLLKQDA